MTRLPLPSSSLRRVVAVLCVAAGLHGGAHSCLTAQVLASQPGKVAQIVDGTTITIEYYRPVARGRELFGGVVRWGDIWTPGANWATTIEVDRAVRINSRPLPKGKYSVWIRPQRDSAWTVMFSRSVRVFHLWPPLPSEEQVRVAVNPQSGPHVEVLTWSFPAVMRDGTVLQLQWGGTIIAMHVSVEPSHPTVLDAPERARYVGRWTLQLATQAGQPPAVVPVEVFEVNGVLRLKGLPGDSALGSVVDLVAIGGSQFHPCYRQAGQPCGADPTVTLVFPVDGERPTSFEVRGPDDRPYGRAVRARP